MLERTTLLDRDGVMLDDVACHHLRGRGEALEPSTGYTLVLVRRGCFLRAADGEQSVLDPTLAFFMRPGEEQRYDHPHDEGDDCTSISLSPELVASLWGGETTLPAGPVSTRPDIDLQHRLLVAAARRGGDADELVERALVLAADVLAQVDGRQVASGRPKTTRARAAIADSAREALAADPGMALPALARELAVSPHHLSRIFRDRAGHTIARHRMRLRARGALERIAGGDEDFARVAAELGFADQSHLNRVLRAEAGITPGALRAAIAG